MSERNTYKKSKKQQEKSGGFGVGDNGGTEDVDMVLGGGSNSAYQ